MITPALSCRLFPLILPLLEGKNQRLETKFQGQKIGLLGRPFSFLKNSTDSRNFGLTVAFIPPS